MHCVMHRRTVSIRSPRPVDFANVVRKYGKVSRLPCAALVMSKPKLAYRELECAARARIGLAGGPKGFIERVEPDTKAALVSSPCSGRGAVINYATIQAGLRIHEGRLSVLRS